LDGTKDQKVSQKLERATVIEHDGEGHGPINRIKTTFNRLRRNKYLMVALGLFFIIFISVGILATIYTKDQQRIQEGVTISGLNVGDLTKDEAKKVVDKEFNRLLSQTIKLNVGKQSPEVKLEDLGLSLDADLALKEAYDIGRTGSIFKKVGSKWAANKGVNIDFSQKWDEKKLGETLQGVLKDFSNPATDATFQVTNENTMIIKSESVGQILDSTALINKVKALDIYKLDTELKADFKEQIPLITAAQLEDQKITGLLSTFTTNFDPSQIARSDNVRIAAKALDMAIIKPGVTLSFNQIVGERTVEGGYKDAYIIVNGEFVPGLAGGICQVSSTLYNTGLLANLAVTQRSNHDLAITYVPLGQDATVAYPDLDLKFNNNTGGYLLVRTKTTNNTLTIEMYGKVKPGQEVTIANTVESTIPPTEQRLVDKTLAHGASVLKQRGQPGSIVKSTRTVKMNGVIVGSEPLKQSRYLALPKIFAVGA